LSVHGNNLFENRLGIDVGGRVAVLIRKLLTPLTLEKLLSHERDLPRYAEAAPDEFLKIIEDRPSARQSRRLRPSQAGRQWFVLCITVANGPSLGVGVPYLETAKSPARVDDLRPAFPVENR